MKPCGRIVLKILELIGCASCLVAKGITDLEEGRIATRNQKLSREWSLLNNVTWDGSGNTFVNITFGGYLIITALMTIARCIDAKSRPHLLEKILLLLGALMFFACAGLILASIEQILPDLYDNAIILGVLSFVVGLLYLIDMADPLARKVPTTTQTDTLANTQINVPNKSTWQKPLTTITPTKISKDVQTDTHSLPTTPVPDYTSRTSTLNRQSTYNAHSLPVIEMHETDFVESKSFPERQSPVFSKVRIPNEKKPIKQKEMARNYYNKGFLEPWEEVELPISTKPPSRSPSKMSRSTRSPDPYHSSTYVPAPSVDRGLSVMRKPKPVLYTYYPDYREDIKELEPVPDEEEHQPIRRGYVAQAAAMWDNRVSGKSTRPSRSPDTVV